MNWPARLFTRSAAAAGSAASARSITNNLPKTSFIARKAAAMPQLVRRNCRRSSPSLGAIASAISLTRSSKRRCCAVCGNGLNSPFDTIWVGTGERNAARSAGSVRESSDLLSIRPIDILPKDLAGSRFDRRGQVLQPRARTSCAYEHKIILLLAHQQESGVPAPPASVRVRGRAALVHDGGVGPIAAYTTGERPPSIDVGVFLGCPLYRASISRLWTSHTST